MVVVGVVAVVVVVVAAAAAAAAVVVVGGCSRGLALCRPHHSCTSRTGRSSLCIWDRRHLNCSLRHFVFNCQAIVYIHGIVQSNLDLQVSQQQDFEVCVVSRKII